LRDLDSPISLWPIATRLYSSFYRNYARRYPVLPYARFCVSEKPYVFSDIFSHNGFLSDIPSSARCRTHQNAHFYIRISPQRVLFLKNDPLFRRNNALSFRETCTAEPTNVGVCCRAALTLNIFCS